MWLEPRIRVLQFGFYDIVTWDTFYLNLFKTTCNIRVHKIGFITLSPFEFYEIVSNVLGYIILNLIIKTMLSKSGIPRFLGGSTIQIRILIFVLVRAVLSHFLRHN